REKESKRWVRSLSASQATRDVVVLHRSSRLNEGLGIVAPEDATHEVGDGARTRRGTCQELTPLRSWLAIVWANSADSAPPLLFWGIRARRARRRLNGRPERVAL